MKRTITLLTLLITAGCTLAWGGSYHEVAATPDMVKYEYEMSTVSDQSMDDAASKHCQQFDKFAHRAITARGGWDYVTIYNCLSQMGKIVPKL